MTFEEQNTIIKANIDKYEDWQIKALIKQFENYNTVHNACGEMIEYLENELINRS